jgi:hypothetical protein
VAIGCAAISAVVVVIESVPNRHHEQAVWLVQAIHDLVF